MFRVLSAPISVQIEVTELCDNTCRHCYNSFRHENCQYNGITHKDIEKIVGELRKCNVVQSVITGGEPLIVPDVTTCLAQQMKESGMRVTLNSNLRLFNKNISKKLKNAGINAIMTSLIADTPDIHDFVTQKKGSWEQTVDGIRQATSAGFRVIVNMVLTKWNVDRIEQTGNFVGGLGIAKFGATRSCAPSPIHEDFSKNLISLNDLRNSLEILYQLKDKWGYEVDVFEHYPWCAIQDIEKYHNIARRKCTAGVFSATIGADGNLRPCGHSSKKFGNVAKEGIKIPWKKMANWRKNYFQPTCIDCKHLKKCTGGCLVEVENSSINRDCHTTYESDVMSLPKILQQNQVKCDIKLSVKKDIVLRKEEFGGIIYSKASKTSLIDDKTFVILKKLQKRESFTVNGVVKEFEIDYGPTQKVITRLISQKMIEERR